MTTTTLLPLRPNVCMLLFNQKYELFLGERYQCPGVWQFPQGGIEEGLSEEENVLKELNEEVGLAAEDVKIAQKLKSRHEYDFRHIPPYALGKWRGQSQSFWLVEFISQDQKINLSTAHPEFMDWRWCSVEQVKTLAEPPKLAGYLGPLGEFEEFRGKKH